MNADAFSGVLALADHAKIAEAHAALDRVLARQAENERDLAAARAALDEATAEHRMLLARVAVGDEDAAKEARAAQVVVRQAEAAFICARDTALALVGEWRRAQVNMIEARHAALRPVVEHAARTRIAAAGRAGLAGAEHADAARSYDQATIVLWEATRRGFAGLHLALTAPQRLDVAAERTLWQTLGIDCGPAV